MFMAVPYVVGARTAIGAELNWTDFDADNQATIMLSLITNHGRATPLVWFTVDKRTLKHDRGTVLRLRHTLPRQHRRHRNDRRGPHRRRLGARERRCPCAAWRHRQSAATVVKHAIFKENTECSVTLEAGSPIGDKRLHRLCMFLRPSRNDHPFSLVVQRRQKIGRLGLVQIVLDKAERLRWLHC
jgi:hypothetical protein